MKIFFDVVKDSSLSLEWKLSTLKINFATEKFANDEFSCKYPDREYI